MIRLWAIGRTTFLQTIRQPIYGVLILVTFAMLAMNLPLSGWTAASDGGASEQRMMESIGLSTLMVTGLLIAAFSAAAALGREIDDKTALTVIAKPVTRATFVLGKFVGVTGAVILAYYLCCLAFLMTVRHGVMPTVRDQFDWPVILLGLLPLLLALVVAIIGNLMFNSTFTSVSIWSLTIFMTLSMGVIAFIGKGWVIVSFGEGISGQLLVAMTLMLMAVVVFAAIAVAASTRFGQVMTLMVCFGVFFMGSMYRSLFGPETQDIFVARVLGAIVPNLTAFYMLDAITLNKPIPGAYFMTALGYCVLYSGAVLALGIALFQTRPLEGQGGSGSMPALVGVLAWLGRAIAVACGIAGGVMLSLSQYHTLSGLTTAGALLAGGAVGWVLWGFFGRGLRWTYWLVIAADAVVLALAGVVAAGVWDIGLGEDAQGLTMRATGLAAGLGVVLLILVLPRTRRHFNS
jgi:ABC-2 type transport system permease protein